MRGDEPEIEMQVENIATIAALAKNGALQTKKSIAEALARPRRRCSLIIHPPGCVPGFF